jgi:hypothetical protein
LVDHCFAQHGRHDFVLHEKVPGPVVFFDCHAVEAYDESGPHHRWDTGVLFDKVTVSRTTGLGGDPRTAGTLEAHDQGMIDGHGWSGANIVFWNCTADKIDVGKPPTAQNWAIGDTTPPPTPGPTGKGFIESANHAVTPDSLYEAQLKDRLARFRPVTSLLHIKATPVLGEANTWSVTVTNASNVFIPGPVLIAFTTLPRGGKPAAIINYTVAGDLFVRPDLLGLAPGQSGTAIVHVNAPLSFTSPEIVGAILAEPPAPPLTLPVTAPPATSPTPPVLGSALNPFSEWSDWVFTLLASSQGTKA